LLGQEASIYLGRVSKILTFVHITHVKLKFIPIIHEIPPLSIVRVVSMDLIRRFNGLFVPINFNG